MTSPSASRNTEKAKLFVEWMEGDHVLVHIDASRSDVEVPDHLKGNPSLTLALSYQFQGETKSDEHGVESYLRFRGNYHRCVMPWEAIWGMTKPEGENRLWPEDLPESLVAKLGAEIAKHSAGAKEGAPEKAPATPTPTVSPEAPQVVQTAEGSCTTERPKPVLTRIK
jgi:hypothetical protein